jgi:aromatic-amino-acid transaminase
VATVQAIGGTGGLKIGADFLKKLSPNAQVLISDPSWENHRALFTNAGFTVGTYAYYDADKRGVNFDGMLASLNAAAPAPSWCCTPAATTPPATTSPRPVGPGDCRGQGQGPDRLPGHGLPGLWPRHCRRRRRDRQVRGRRPDIFVSTSFSKSFSLYGERVGALSVLCESKEEAAAC